MHRFHEKKDVVWELGTDRYLKVSSSPFVRSSSNIRKIMLCVIIALLPSLISSCYFFGTRALCLSLVCVASCCLFQFLCDLLHKRAKSSLGDLSCVVTGLLLALNVPVTLPYWIAVLGSGICIVIAKEVFGGIGYNIFNPALVGRVFLLICFPAIMSNFGECVVDGISGPTPLTILKVEGISALSNFEIYKAFSGQILGSIGETSALAILVGGIFLVICKCIRLVIPLSFILSFLAISTLNFYLNPTLSDFTGFNFCSCPLLGYLSFHVLTGGLLLGAFFMATDMVTSPVTWKGKLLFGIGCGVLTAIIRLYGSYPEGVSFAILIMNSLVPLIDRFCLRKYQV